MSSLGPIVYLCDDDSESLVRVKITMMFLYWSGAVVVGNLTYFLAGLLTDPPAYMRPDDEQVKYVLLMTSMEIWLGTSIGINRCTPDLYVKFTAAFLLRLLFIYIIGRAMALVNTRKLMAQVYINAYAFNMVAGIAIGMTVFPGENGIQQVWLRISRPLAAGLFCYAFYFEQVNAYIMSRFVNWYARSYSIPVYS